ncbi:DUF6471 domain-containing protein [Aquabacterium sp.]|uniref:DUF6471 domain-containing protein n=1 Tax=Aquabacterium sp. TaxID=1872578 RepID=UPI002631343F|nr:DUF6471 domain-containing protein [Aquabacterium sp.]MDD2977139.1 DUF6471 domain-containing protein [Aquabacterium sp.]
MSSTHTRNPQSFTGQEPEPLATEATRILRAEMARRGISYKELAEAMSHVAGEPMESTQALINKVNRGRFSFAFFLRACRAMGVTTVDLADLPMLKLDQKVERGGS